MTETRVRINATPGKAARIATALDLYSVQCEAEGNLIEASFAARDRDVIRLWLLERAVAS